MKFLLQLPFVAFFAMSCTHTSGTPDGRISKNPQFYKSLDGHEQLMVKTGQIENGMSKSSVWLAWGEPAAKNHGQNGSTRTEKWIYRNYRPIYTQSVFGGSGYGRLHGRRHYNYGYNGIGLGLGVNYVPYPSAHVDFENDRVVRWTRGSRR